MGTVRQDRRTRPIARIARRAIEEVEPSSNGQSSRNGRSEKNIVVERSSKLAKLYQDRFEVAEKRVTACVYLLTPEEAAAWMTKNKNNRPLSERVVNRYESFVGKGQIVVNGETIIRDEDGNLLDGQHRCEAISRGSVAVPILLVDGVSRSVFPTLNCGKTRSVADTLAIRGERQYTTTAAALGWLHRYLANDGDMSVHDVIRPSNQEISDMLKAHPGVRESVDYVTRLRRRGYNSGAFSFLHYVCTGKHPDHADFFERILTGVNIPAMSPESVFDRWMRDYTAGKTYSQTIEMVACCIKAWNGRVKNIRIATLRWSNVEGFPRIA